MSPFLERFCIALAVLCLQLLISVCVPSVAVGRAGEGAVQGSTSEAAGGGGAPGERAPQGAAPGHTREEQGEGALRVTELFVVGWSVEGPPSLLLHLHDLCQTQEELVLQLMEQTTALDEDKNRLSNIVRELKAEREGHLKLIEELAVKACQ